MTLDLGAAEVFVAPAGALPPVPAPRRPHLAPVPLTCRWCTHPWHGLPCRANPCRCESTVGARDDTWRPGLVNSRADQASKVMHDTGVDGWVASLAVSTVVSPGRNPYRLRAVLYGRSR